MNLALKYKDQMQLDFDHEIWGYSLLTVLQTYEEKIPTWVLSASIETIQKLLSED